MKRRDALRSAAVLMGAGLSAGTVSAILGSCNPSAGATAVAPNSSSSFLSAEQLNLVAEIAERILPASDTPGAKDVEVHKFIDRQVALNASDEEKAMFLDGLTYINSKSDEVAGGSFADLGDQERDQVLQAVVDEWQAAPRDNRFFPAFRGLVVTGYFTSERVCKEVLVYDPIPGEFNGCVDYNEGDPLWAI